MNNNSAESLFTSGNSQSFNIVPKPNVRYRGFEGIPGGRRLMFSVKPNGEEWQEVTIEISNTTFIGAPLSMQDAAPMAYEKLLELLLAERPLQSDDLSLTDADIMRYRARHLSSQKRRFGVNRPDVAA
jgi:hypothetical protein